MSRTKLGLFCLLSMLIGVAIGGLWIGSGQLQKMDQHSEVVVFPIIRPCNAEIHSLLQSAVVEHQIAYKLNSFNSGGPILELVPGWISIVSDGHSIFELHSVAESILAGCYPNVVEDHQFNEDSRVKMSATGTDTQYTISLRDGLSRKDFFRELSDK